MVRSTESVVSTIPGTSENDRLVVVLCHRFGEKSRLELRQQSWSDGIGWFTQSSIAIDPAQAHFVRAALGGIGVKLNSRGMAVAHSLVGSSESA